MKQITTFLFNIAEYIVEDNNGNTVKLKMNYRDNTYLVEGDANPIVHQIAQDLLMKKHAVNFADKFAEYTLE